MSEDFINAAVLYEEKDTKKKEAQHAKEMDELKNQQAIALPRKDRSSYILTNKFQLIGIPGQTPTKLIGEFFG